jgi:hypothetical protein
MNQAMLHTCRELLKLLVREDADFWVVAQYGVVEVYRHFIDTCCLHHQGNDHYPGLDFCFFMCVYLFCFF